MPVPNSQQVLDALLGRNVALDCRSCGNATQLKMDVAGVNLTTLGAGAVNTSTTTARWTPMALIICGVCGETRFYHLEWLGFKPPY